MNVDPFKIVGLISALFAIGDKVYTYAQKWRESRRKPLLKKSSAFSKFFKKDKGARPTLSLKKEKSPMNRLSGDMGMPFRAFLKKAKITAMERPQPSHNFGTIMAAL
jgi:hypothetical protein